MLHFMLHPMNLRSLSLSLSLSLPACMPLSIPSLPLPSSPLLSSPLLSPLPSSPLPSPPLLIPLLSSPLLSLNLFVCLSLSVQDITGKIWRRNAAKTEVQQQNERKLENWINYISLHWDVLNKLATLCKYKFVVSLKLDHLISPQIQFPMKKCVCLRKTSLLIYVNIRPSKFVCLFWLVQLRTSLILFICSEYYPGMSPVLLSSMAEIIEHYLCTVCSVSHWF